MACNAPFAVTPQGHCVCPIGWQAATNQFGETTCLAPGSALDPLVANITEQISNLTTIVQNITAARPARRALNAGGAGTTGARHVTLRSSLFQSVGSLLPVPRAMLCMQSMWDHIAGVLHDYAARRNADTCLIASFIMAHAITTTTWHTPFQLSPALKKHAPGCSGECGGGGML